jgi:hypothetical protein
MEPSEAKRDKPLKFSKKINQFTPQNWHDFQLNRIEIIVNLAELKSNFLNPMDEMPAFFGAVLADTANDLDEYASSLRSSVDLQTYYLSQSRNLANHLSSLLNDRPSHPFSPIQFLTQQIQSAIDSCSPDLPIAKQFSDSFSTLRRDFTSFLSLSDSVISDRCKQVRTERFLKLISENSDRLQERARSLRGFTAVSPERCVWFSGRSANPCHTIYEHCFVSRYFGSAIFPINSGFLSRFFSRFLTQTTCADRQRILESVHADLEGQIPALLALRSAALGSCAAARLLEKFPDRESVRSSPQFAGLRATSARLRDRVRMLETSQVHFPGACLRIRRAAGAAALAVQEFDSAISECTRRFFELDSASSAISLNHRVLTFLKLVTATTGPCGTIHARFRQLSVRRPMASERHADALHLFCEELSARARAFEGLASEAEQATLAKDRMLQKLGQPSLRRQPTALRGELEARRIAIAEISRTMHSAAVLQAREFSAAVEFAAAAFDEFGRIARAPDAGQLADMIAESPTPVIEWKTAILAEKERQIAEKKKELEMLLGESAVGEEVLRNDITDAAVGAILKAQLACAACDFESSHVLAGCGHLLCAECAKKSARAGRCRACQGHVAHQDVIEVCW